MTESRSVSEELPSHDPTSTPSPVQLVCPLCHTVVKRCDDAWVCESSDCRRSYPIIDDIPKFIVEDADQLEPEKWNSLVPHTGSD